VNAPQAPHIAPEPANRGRRRAAGVPAIDVHALCHVYAEGPAALSGVDLCIEAGEAVAIVGANGAGKSTLLQHLNGLLLPAAGSVHIEGIELGPRTLAEVRRRVGYVFQDADDQLFMPTVRDDVAFGPLNQGLSLEEAHGRTDTALAGVGAAHLASRAPYRLSGGEKRAVAIAGVLAMRPSILVLDEPSSGLDPLGRERLIGLLRSFTHTRVIATHDLDLALQVCARVVVLQHGQCAAQGAAAEILGDGALLRRCGLAAPSDQEPAR